MKYGYPSLIGLENKKKTISIPDITAATTIELEVVLPENYLVIGTPNVTTDNASLKVKIINGGFNKFTVEITNTDDTLTVSGANLIVDVIGINGV